MKIKLLNQQLLPGAIVFAFFWFLPVATSLAAAFNVRDFGAKADGTNNDAPAIQGAIDACNQSGGGEVVIPAGNYFSGKIVLKSNVTLKLENGAAIFESGEILDFDKDPPKGEHGYLIVATNQQNLVICGDGKIIGTGQEDLGRRNGEAHKANPSHRFGIVHFEDCQNVRLRNVTILDSEAHAVVFDECQNVFVDSVSIINNYFRVNTDGIDPDSCTNVFISNCYIVAGDDCICPKTDNGSLENLVVENCILESISAGFKLGTGSRGDFRDITVANCVIRNSGIGLGLFIKDGGTAERISFSNISIETTRKDTPVNSGLRNTIIPIYIDLTKRTPDSPLSRIRNVSFSNIQISSDNSIVIQGLTNRPIEGLMLDNITFRVNNAFDFSQRTKREGGESTYRDENRTLYVRQPTWCALANVKDFAVYNLHLSCGEDISKEFPRSVISIFNSQNGMVKNVSRAPAPPVGAPAVLVLKDCSSVSGDPLNN
jgi:polygalacturonase